MEIIRKKREREKNKQTRNMYATFKKKPTGINKPQQQIPSFSVSGYGSYILTLKRNLCCLPSVAVTKSGKI